MSRKDRRETTGLHIVIRWWGLILSWRKWRNGIREGLKNLCLNGHEGSIPSFRTNRNEDDMDIFRRFNNPKRRCSYCAPYKGENENLKVFKNKARRRARHTLKKMLLDVVVLL